MARYEYKAVPAPKKGKKAKGLRSPEDRFANAVTELMNDMAQDGWDYIRSDTLPSEERSGLTGKTTVFQNILVFRRDLDDAAPANAAPHDDEDENAFADLGDDAEDTDPEAPLYPADPADSETDRDQDDAPKSAKKPRLTASRDL